MTMLLKSTGGGEPMRTCLGVTLMPSAARLRTVSSVSSTSSSPFLKTSTSSSSSSLPAPSVTVVHAPFFNSNVRRPFFDFLPGSVIGSLTTSTPWPFTFAKEHLKAHFCVSRCIFCSKAPPLPKAKLSAAQPFAAISLRTISSEAISMPSPWMTRMQGGRSLWPVLVCWGVNLLPSFSNTWMTMPGSSPLSGRTTRTPSRFSIMSLSSFPQ
mmetsp:Transcript_59888/g.139531  ORF Transcript_59888/g.139531 Transcript_59888/m.139531 type:complete len:211 (-) Transcript_59888:993-1625(-)